MADLTKPDDRGIVQVPLGGGLPELVYIVNEPDCHKVLAVGLWKKQFPAMWAWWQRGEPVYLSDARTIWIRPSKM